MKKAILCFPKIESSQNQHPIGLYKIASYCNDTFDIIVLDERIENIESKIDEILVKNDGDILCIGFSVMTGEQIKSAIRLSKLYHCKTKIVWGGIHPSILPEQTVTENYIDYVVVGEGEEAFKSLLSHLDNAETGTYSETFFDNILYKSKEYNICKNLDNYIDFESYPIKEEYFTNRDGFLRCINFETSRGCPFKCAYCHNSIFKKQYRYMSANAVNSIIDFLITNYNIDGVVFQEDNFFVNKQRNVEIIEYLKGSSIGWKANARIDFFHKIIKDESFINDLIASKCRTLQFGIESGTQRILDLINKKITLSQIREANKVLAKLPIKVRYNFIIGFPTETINEIYTTMEFIQKLQKENPNMEPPFLNIFTPYPGTKLFKEAIKLGFSPPINLSEWSAFSWNNAPLSYLGRELADELKKISNDYIAKVNYPI